MFGSISLATPNSTVTSSFTAVEACQVGVGAEYTVRLNGQNVTTRPFAVIKNDLVEIDVAAPDAAGYKFVPWTYNGVQSYFAVVSRQATNRATLKVMYRRKMWYSYPVTLSPRWSYKSGNNAAVDASTNGTDSGFQGSDLVVLMDPLANSAHFIRSDNARVYQLNLPAKPIAHSRLFNGATRAWESYFLGGDGIIYYYAYNHAMTKSSTALANANSMWSSGTTLFVGGQGFVKILSDINTVTQTITTTENIVYGVTTGATIFAVSESGKIFKVDNGALTQLYSASMVGSPTVFKNQVVFPIPEEYKLRIYNVDGSFSQDLPTGDLLPWACVADRNATMAVTFADNTNVGLYTALSGDPTMAAFPFKVTFAVPIGPAVFADHYLRQFTITAPANPPITGVNFKAWNAPIGVDVGTGEQTLTTDASDLTAAASPNATMLVNGLTGATVVNNGNSLALITRSQQGRQSAAVVLGNYAWDFKINALPSTSFSTFISQPFNFRANQVVFNITVPAQVKDAPIALSHGNLVLNGNPYDGQTLVQAQDSLKITINVPASRNSYYSMLSIADSQYALVINTASVREASLERYQDYLSTTTTSTFTIDETGTYDLPNYTGVTVSKNNAVLTFPTTLTIGDVIVVNHTRMSSWWFDERDTALMGPSSTLVFKGVTAVDDAPDNIDLGTVHDGIPDFSFDADGQGTIAGLSDKYSVVIFGDDMLISVNGAPAVAKPTVKNGDVIRVTYIVHNLFDDRYVKTTLYDGRDYEFGVVHINPAKGVNWLPHRNDNAEPIYWDRAVVVPTQVAAASSMWQQGEQNSSFAINSQYSSATIGTGLQSVSQFETSPVQAKTPAPASQWEMGITQSKTIMAEPGWEMGIAQNKTPLPKPVADAPSTVVKSPKAKIDFYPVSASADWTPVAPIVATRSNYLDYDIEEKFITSFGHMSIFRTFEAYWEPFQDITARSVQVDWTVYSFNNIHSFDSYSTAVPSSSYAKFNPVWQNIARGPDLLVGIVGEHDDPNRVWVNIDSGLFAFEAWDHDVPVDLTPRFETMQKQLFGQQKPLYVSPDKIFFGTNQPLKVQKGLAMAAGSSGVYVTDVHWSGNNPLAVGGYATESDALAAGEVVAAGKLDVETYKQPEGAFSYVVKRETTLFCEIKTSDIVTGKWLLGGG